MGANVKYLLHKFAIRALYLNDGYLIPFLLLLSQLVLNSEQPNDAFMFKCKKLSPQSRIFITVNRIKHPFLKHNLLIKTEFLIPRISFLEL